MSMPYRILKWYQLGSLILGQDCKKGKTPSLSWKTFRILSLCKYKELNQGCRSLSMNLKRSPSVIFDIIWHIWFSTLTEAWIYDDYGEGSTMTLSPIMNAWLSSLGKGIVIWMIYGIMSKDGCQFGKSVIFSFGCMHQQCNQKELFEVRISMRYWPILYKIIIRNIVYLAKTSSLQTLDLS